MIDRPRPLADPFARIKRLLAERKFALAEIRASDKARRLERWAALARLERNIDERMVS